MESGEIPQSTSIRAADYLAEIWKRYFQNTMQERRLFTATLGMEWEMLRNVTQKICKKNII